MPRTSKTADLREIELTVDVGNSTVGLAYWEPGGQVPTAVECLVDPAAAGARVRGRRTAVISVAPLRLRALLAAAGPDVLVLTKPEIALASDSLADTAGADRIAVVTAALPGPAVCVDAGTAVTVDLLDRDGVYRGGFIAAGPAAARAGLEQQTEVLPSGSGQAVALGPGLDTATALAAGAWGLCVGGVDRLVAEGLAALGGRDDGPVSVLVTGGWGRAYLEASRLDRYVDEPVVSFDRDLVHRGIRIWAREAWARS